jgi:hypothetical protein
MQGSATELKCHGFAIPGSQASMCSPEARICLCIQLGWCRYAMQFALPRPLCGLLVCTKIAHLPQVFVGNFSSQHWVWSTRNWIGRRQTVYTYLLTEYGMWFTWTKSEDSQRTLVHPVVTLIVTAFASNRSSQKLLFIMRFKNLFFFWITTGELLYSSQ